MARRPAGSRYGVALVAIGLLLLLGAVTAVVAYSRRERARLQAELADARRHAGEG